MDKLLLLFKNAISKDPKHSFNFFDIAEECSCSEKELDQLLRDWNAKGYLSNIFSSDNVFSLFSLSDLGIQKLLGM